ncbi:MAG: MarR family transcriptional regulator [Melioribacteraceae bacterium]|nr:MarR family transcriptional regulator [Melioribacteraceae bacterium]
MKLETQIHQKKFKNEFQKLAINIPYTYGWLNSIQQSFFKKYDMSTQQYNILRILRGQYPKCINVNDVKSRMIDKMPDVSRIVERLRKKNLLEREICSEDRRRANLKITQKGLELLTEMDKYEDDVTNIFNLTKSEVKQLNDLLDKARG